MVELRAWSIVFFLWVGISSAYAAENGELTPDTASLDANAISVYGADCEKIKPEEARSTVRVRVTDKASYTAVSRLPDLKSARVELNEHDFNVMVYNLVDNDIEDMAVRTTKQTPEEICVEVTGYISSDNIFAAVEEALNRQRGEETKNTSEPEEQSNITEQLDAPQPLSVGQVEQPQSAPLSEPKEKETLYKPEIPAEPIQKVQASTESPQDNEYLQAKTAQKGLVYVAPTTFFNNTSSSKHSKVLSDLFAKSNYFYITDNADLADYVISSKVLRAKVDPINKDTNRMQMVVALESKNVNSGETETEHQNRFVLFSATENEQAVAQKLMKQLFEKASDKIITRLEIEVRKKTNTVALPSVITPAAAPQLKKDAR